MNDMSYTIDYGYTRPLTSKNLAISATAVTTAWQPTSEVSNSPETTEFRAFTNSTQTSRSFGPKLKKFRRIIKDIYANKQISKLFQGAVSTGHTVGGTIRINISKVLDDGTVTVYPIEWELTGRIPDDECITTTVVQNTLNDFLSSFYPQGSTTFNQFAAQMNGSFDWLDETT